MHWTRYATLTALALVGTIGAIDSALEGEWDSVILFVLVIVLTLPLLTSLDRSRRLVLLRTDLARWVDHRSATTGEPPGAVVDRAVARHRERIEALAAQPGSRDGGRTPDGADDARSH
jgi:hypothetical protein